MVSRAFLAGAVVVGAVPLLLVFIFNPVLQYKNVAIFLSDDMYYSRYIFPLAYVNYVDPWIS
jgi:hypothetical protein